jgi:hypothetical protein
MIGDPGGTEFVKLTNLGIAALDEDVCGEPSKSNGQADTRTDTKKKSKKARRLMNSAASDCARKYRKRKQREPGIALKSVVSEYVDEHPEESVEGIYRRLLDNPGAWKKPADS